MKRMKMMMNTKMMCLAGRHTKTSYTGLHNDEENRGSLCHRGFFPDFVSIIDECTTAVSVQEEVFVNMTE